MEYVNVASTIFLMFFIYSVLGYIGEVLYCFCFHDRKIENRGFMFGPYCPIYGFGSLAIIFMLKQYMNDPLILACMIAIVTSIIEYIGGYLLEKTLKSKWWDYSHLPFNINGRVWLVNSALFGVMGLVIMYVINPFVMKYLDMVSPEIKLVLTIIIFIILLIDFIKSLTIALGFRETLKSIQSVASKYIEEEYAKLIQKKNESLENISIKLKETLGDKINEINQKDFKSILKNITKVNITNFKLDELSILKNNVFSRKSSKSKEDKTDK